MSQTKTQGQKTGKPQTTAERLKIIRKGRPANLADLIDQHQKGEKVDSNRLRTLIREHASVLKRYLRRNYSTCPVAPNDYTMRASISYLEEIERLCASEPPRKQAPTTAS